MGCLKGLLGGGLGSRRTFRVVGAKAIYQWRQKYFIILITIVAVFVCNGWMSLRYRGHKECHLRDVQVPQFSSSLQSSLSFQTLGFPVAQQIHLQCRRQRRLRFDPWVGNIPWSRKWKPTPVFLPGKSHGQRSLVGYSLWGRKELDTIEHTDEVCSFRKSASYVLKFRENFFCSF